MQPHNNPEIVVRVVLMSVHSNGSPWYTISFPLEASHYVHSVHESRGCLKACLIVFNFDRIRASSGPVIFFAKNLPMGCGTTYNASWGASHHLNCPIMPSNHPFMILWCIHGKAPKRSQKLFLCSFKAVGVLNIPSNVPSSHPTIFGARVLWTSKSVTYSLQFWPF